MTQLCPHCQKTNRDTAGFCQHCGQPLHPICPHCQTPNKPGAKFCFACGRSLTTAVAPTPSPPPPTPTPAGAAVLWQGATGMLRPQSLLNNRYLILKRLGAGGQAAVYMAEDTRLSGKLCAVKEMSDVGLDPAERQEALAAFRREAQLLATLKHPNLPTVSDSFHDQGKEYLVMDYVAGETLAQKLKQNGGRPLPTADVLNWAAQLCDVLDYLHHRPQPIIFRDLKPGNIMINNDGQVKLIDFGIARLFKAGQAKDTAAFGTDGYAPPEQYGQGQTDARSDVYALGATLHHLLTGRDPGVEPFKFPPLRQLNSGVDTAVAGIIMRALQTNPAQRWPDMAAFRAALPLPAVPQPTSGAYRMSPVSPPVAVPPLSAPPVAAPPDRAILSERQPVLPPSVASQLASSLAYGGLDTAVLGRRAAAHLIDGLIMLLPGAAFGAFIAWSIAEKLLFQWAYEYLDLLFYSYEELYAFTTLLGFLFGTVMGLLYYGGFHGWRGQTPGKMLMSIRVVRADGSRLGWGRACWRLLAWQITATLGIVICLGIIPYAIPFLNQERRALHDYLAGTLVVRV
ncbi:MAG: protein kinase [Anaerolinea sp.]|nr:protein kinase [Anaerolinea sp.]